MPPPRSLPRARGDASRRILLAWRLLRETPHRPVDLVALLECDRSTVERILAGIRAAGEPLVVEHVGRDAWYSITRSEITP